MAAMRVGRDELVFLGLLALDDVRDLAMRQPLAPSWGLRLLLQLLFALSNGERWAYDEFWRSVQIADHPLQKKVPRATELHPAWGGIVRSLGLVDSLNLQFDFKLARGHVVRCKADEPPAAPLSRKEEARRELAIRLGGPARRANARRSGVQPGVSSPHHLI